MVEVDIRTDLLGSPCCWTVSYFSGRTQRGQGQRSVFSGFLKSNNILPAWLDDGNPAELAEEWGFINLHAPMHQDGRINGGHACFVPKEDPRLLPEPDPEKIKVLSLHMGCLQGDPLVINAIDMSGEAFEVAVHGLETPMRSVAIAIKKQQSLPADVIIKLVTPAGELLQDADMLSKALDRSSSRAECHGVASLELQSDVNVQPNAEVLETVDRFLESLYRRMGDRTDLSPSAMLKLLEVAIAEERPNLAPEVESALWEMVRVLRYQEACDQFERQLEKTQAFIEEQRISDPPMFHEIKLHTSPRRERRAYPMIR